MKKTPFEKLGGEAPGRKKTIPGGQKNHACNRPGSSSRTSSTPSRDTNSNYQ